MRWEYRIEMFPHLLDVDARNMLATLGEEGWELAGLAPAETGGGVLGVLKRPKEA
jgi:hypothetical protein